MPNSINLSIPNLSVRALSFKGYPLTVTMLNDSTTHYQLVNGQAVIEVQNGHVLFVDDHGNTNLITRDHIVYKELMYRVLNSDVLEDGTYKYSPTIQ